MRAEAFGLGDFPWIRIPVLIYSLFDSLFQGWSGGEKRAFLGDSANPQAAARILPRFSTLQISSSLILKLFSRWPSSFSKYAHDNLTFFSDVLLTSNHFAVYPHSHLLLTVHSLLGAFNVLAVERDRHVRNI